MSNREQGLESPMNNGQGSERNIPVEVAVKVTKMAIISGGGYLLVDSIKRNPFKSRRQFLISGVKFVVGNTIVGTVADSIK